MDAHCPHLGAHLAVGGKVEGDRLRCPFHGWAFDGESGACVDIPYGEGTRIPARAAARAYPTLERNGMVWAWHHAEGGEPFYDVPVVAEFDDPAWSPVVVRAFEVAVPAQDMAENNVDYAHFRFVHGTEAIPEDEFFVDGTYKRAVGMDGNFVREGVRPRPRRAAHHGLRDLHLLDHAHRRGERARPLGVHRPRQRRGRRGPGRRVVLRRRQPGHPHLGEQDLPAPPRY